MVSLVSHNQTHTFSCRHQSLSGRSIGHIGKCRHQLLGQGRDQLAYVRSLHRNVESAATAHHTQDDTSLVINEHQQLFQLDRILAVTQVQRLEDFELLLPRIPGLIFELSSLPWSRRWSWSRPHNAAASRLLQSNSLLYRPLVVIHDVGHAFDSFCLYLSYIILGEPTLGRGHAYCSMRFDFPNVGKSLEAKLGRSHAFHLWASCALGRGHVPSLSCRSYGFAPGRAACCLLALAR
jgi:hypothetical protein